MSQSAERPAGYELPIVQALTEPVLMGGLPREYAILMGTLAAVIGLGLKLWWLGLIWWACAHALGLWAARRDPSFMAVLRRHLRTPGHLDA
jgi:type IV secretion system protein VirB3